MYQLDATIKAPESRKEGLIDSLRLLGVEQVRVTVVPYAQFVQESRLNWDCVFPEMWSEEQDVVYLDFSFEDSDSGRQAAYQVEFQLPQIPLNLRYDVVEVEGRAGL